MQGTKTEIVETILSQIRKERPNIENKKIKNIEKTLTKATLDEVQRIANAFYRFGVDAIFESINHS